MADTQLALLETNSHVSHEGQISDRWKGKKGGDYNPGRTSKIQQSIKLRALLIEEGLKGSGIVDMDTGEELARIQNVVRKIYDEAEAGQAWAAGLIFERIAGKAATALPDGGDNGPQVMLVIRGASTEEL